MGHLILSRKRGERVNIGDNVQVEVVDILHNKVRLAFTADKAITILRTELLCSLCNGTHKPGPCEHGGEGGGA
jgi:carbon storage regulator CsrA